MKANRIGEGEVRDEPQVHGREGAAWPRSSHPRGERPEGRAPAAAFGDKQRSADPEPGRGKSGEPGGTELLPRHGREPLDVPEDERGECDERRAQDRVVDLYLASPTALSAAPRFLSASAMKLAVRAGSAQTTPKPRLAMKSL